MRDRATGRDADQLGAELVGRLGGTPACRRVSFYGMVVVRCEAESR